MGRQYFSVSEVGYDSVYMINLAPLGTSDQFLLW